MMDGFGVVVVCGFLRKIRPSQFLVELGVAIIIQIVSDIFSLSNLKKSNMVC